MSACPTVYLVDDDSCALDSLRYLMESVGLPVMAFSSAAGLLQAHQGEWIGCLVADMRMPGMSGLELQERLAALGSQLPVIVVTGHGDVSTCTRAFRHGAIDFVEKPVDDQYLLDRIQQAMARGQERTSRPAHSAEVERRFGLLTNREQQVLWLAAMGKSLKQIAHDLDVGLQTAAKHRSRMLEKMQVANEVLLVHLLAQADLKATEPLVPAGARA